MAKEYFVLGIGGTGMRCIEALVHLCAMGMFDDTELHLLALDTDKNNGNFGRLKSVKDAYLNVKSLDNAGRKAGNNSFFTADIKYYEFSPNYETKSTFKQVFNYGDTQRSNSTESDLADLMFSNDVEEFNLRHGYRAQTHLGSIMMYHSIIEAVKDRRNNDLKRFLNNLNTSSANGNPRVFILGSVFGGTGASSIPIIPQALAQAAGILANGASNILENAYFGSILLTAYFSFTAPSADERKKQKVIATADRFALNSQVAMMFYQDDANVQTTYQKFYMMGTQGLSWNPMETQNQAQGETITGGDKQKNDSHYIELLAACAALDFYSLPDDVLAANRTNGKTDYQYRMMGDKMEFRDFVGDERQTEFAHKFGMLTVASILCNDPDYNFVEGLQNGAVGIKGFEDVNAQQIKSLKNYFNLFDFKVNGNNTLAEGWLRQIYRSAGGQDKFLFATEIFSPQNVREMTRCDWNKKLYRNEGIGKDNKFATGLLSNKYNELKSNFLNVYKDGENLASNIFDNRMEQLLKQLYDTLTSLYQFK